METVTAVAVKSAETSPLEPPHTKPQQLFQNLSNKLGKYLQPEQIVIVRQAFDFADPMHRGQLRKSGEPYITHPLAVAEILAEMHLDEKTLAAAILHDVIEDTDADKQKIRTLFGQTVAELVDGVSKLERIEHFSPQEALSHNFYKMVLATARDVRVILVKLADRLHNMRTISALPLKRRKQIALETLDYFAPIAMRLGMDDIRSELEDLSFNTLYPMRAHMIQSAIDKATKNRSDLMNKVRGQITSIMKQRRIRAKVIGRQKNIYSIYKKMSEKNQKFDEIVDVFGFRIIVRDVNLCYRTLGVMHQLYKPIHERFKDYIALPKDNGYQSLHTVLFGPFGVHIEIQVRTESMDQMASHGIAAHNYYKLGESGAKDRQNRNIRDWINNLLELQKGDDATVFTEQLRADLFPDEIYLFTPRGDIIKLPKGATPVDFAYAVHSDIGNQCIGCFVDRRPAVLNTRLENSQTVEITTSESTTPNPSWINFVTTEKARWHIRQHLRQRQHSEATMLGRQLLDRSLLSLNSAADIIDTADRRSLLKDYQLKEWTDLLAEIGFGKRSAPLVAQRLLKKTDNDRNNWWSLPRYFRIGSRYQPLQISGTEGMVVHFGQCCSPIPGDEIIGIFNPGRGLMVHAAGCNEIKRSQKKMDSVSLNWADKTEGDYTARLRISVSQGKGALADLAAVVSDQNANVEKLSFAAEGYGKVVILHIGIRDRIHLANAIRKLRSLKHVSRVARIMQ